MNIAVLSSSLVRSRRLASRLSFLDGKFDIRYLATHASNLGRGCRFKAIYVDPEVWPLSDNLLYVLAPTLVADGGGFFVFGEIGVSDEQA